MAQLIVDAMLSEIDGTRRFRDHYVFEPQLVARGTTHSYRPLQYAVG